MPRLVRQVYDSPALLLHGASPFDPNEPGPPHWKLGGPDEQGFQYRQKATARFRAPIRPTHRHSNPAANGKTAQCGRGFGRLFVDGLEIPA